MSEQKHTKTPWTAEPSHASNDPVIANVNGDGFWVVSATEVSDRSAEANARLIAAAPDMLEALKGLLQQNEEFCQRTGLGDTDQMEAARAAISKALTP